MTIQPQHPCLQIATAATWHRRPATPFRLGPLPTCCGCQLGQRGDQLLGKVGIALVQGGADGQGGGHVLEAQRRLAQRAHHLRHVL